MEEKTKKKSEFDIELQSNNKLITFDTLGEEIIEKYEKNKMFPINETITIPITGKFILSKKFKILLNMVKRIVKRKIKKKI